MADISGVRDLLMSTIEVFPEKSRLEFGGTEVSFHCDKFNTRVVKGFEDVVGYDDAYTLLSNCAETTHYGLLKSFFGNGEAASFFDGLSPEEKLAAIFEVYKVFAYGAFDGGVNENGGTVTSATSYVAEGWLENMERWKWAYRDNPVCHDACGQIAAAMALAFGKDTGTYKVVENKCRSKGEDICEFAVEVR
jgi:hypothetical protein